MKCWTALEKGYVVMFKDKTCEVFDTTGTKLMSIKMKGKASRQT